MNLFKIKVGDIVRVKPSNKKCKVFKISDPQEPCMTELKKYWKRVHNTELKKNFRIVTVRFKGNFKEYIYPKCKVRKLFLFQSRRKRIWNKKDKSILTLRKKRTLKLVRESIEIEKQLGFPTDSVIHNPVKDELFDIPYWKR